MIMSKKIKINKNKHGIVAPTSANEKAQFTQDETKENARECSFKNWTKSIRNNSRTPLPAKAQ